MKKIIALVTALFLIATNVSFAQSFSSSAIPMGNINVLGTATLATPLSEASGGSVYVNADKYASQGLQAAINATPCGGTLFIGKNGFNAKTSQANSSNELVLIQACVKNIECSGWDAPITVTNDASWPANIIRVAGPSNGQKIHSCYIKNASAPGATNTLTLDATSTYEGSNIIDYFKIEHNKFDNFGGLGINVVFPLPYLNGVFDGNIQYNFINGGISLNRAGDNNVLSHNLITGAGPGIYMNSVIGANTNVIANNTIVSCNGSIKIDYAMHPVIINNELEPQSGCALESNGALLDLNGSAANPITNAIIKSNQVTMQPGTATSGIRVNYAQNTQLDNTVMTGNATMTQNLITANALNTVLSMTDVGDGSGIQTQVKNFSATTAIKNTVRGSEYFLTPENFYNLQPGGATVVTMINGNGQNGSTYPLSLYKTQLALPVFTGTLNDLTAGGLYNAGFSATYCVVIDSVGAVDTFKWG
ncbi:hypothetical protein ACO0K2_17670, partial [Undibacterium sp. MH2W]|uniref:hypothetical protein n=1 Tax=Undibacterium sp. MH2W TaxID=3413044 RepID=UPI003BF3D80D